MIVETSVWKVIIALGLLPEVSVRTKLTISHVHRCKTATNNVSTTSRSH